MKLKLSETLSSTLIMHYLSISQSSSAQSQRFLITVLALGLELITETFIPLTLEI